jgi:fructosamine-3-kinase
LNPSESRHEVFEEVESGLGASIRSLASVSGGDIADSYRVETESGERLFIKTYRSGPTGIGEAEAQGLEWLAAARALRVPEVAAQGGTWLALEWIEPGRPAADFDEALGAGLARIHASGSEHFGGARDNFIATLPQSNRTHESWESFYATERLRPRIESATSSGRLPAGMRDRFDTLFDRLAGLVGPSEAPARLHGDLWSGNLLVDESGGPCLVDPAAYGGHREVDLAMMRLFGGFSERVFEVYAQTTPLAAGVERRVALYQLYPLLVHVCLFGGGYLGQLETTLRAALRVV